MTVNSSKASYVVHSYSAPHISTNRAKKRNWEARVRATIESIGGKVLYVNWKKRTVHMLTSKGIKRVAHIDI